MWNTIGQNKVVDLLERGIISGGTAHAYLFTGPEHIGKMTLALELAMALNCQSAQSPCHECPACKKIDNGNHTDIQVIRLTRGEDNAPVTGADEDSADTTNGAGSEATRIKIDQIKEIQHSASLPPFEGKHRVYIIEGAEQLSNEAANRLLKTLEEPPDKVTFILITVNEKLLLSTVVSRCQRIEFQPMPMAEEAAALEKKLNIDPERAKLLAALSRGCPGWAITAAGDENVLEERNFNLNRILSTIKADASERFTYAAQLATGFSQNRKAVYDILNMWEDYWRDMMLVKTGCPQLIINIDRKDEIIKMAGSFSLVKIKDFIKSTGATAGQLKQNVNSRLALEVLMLDMPREEILSTKL
jgi:DNA polymerase III subunit delta'